MLARRLMDLPARALGRGRASMRSRAERRRRSRISGWISSPGAPEAITSEAVFDALNAEYPARTGYGYSPLDVWWRGVTRCHDVLRRIEHAEPGLDVLEVACGDGMVSAALHAFGHRVHATDVEDWRDPRARDLRFSLANAAESLPAEDGSVDLALSYNALIHLSDPGRTLDELHRVLRPGGHVYLEFGHLYPGPWGLHAYRTVRMPYPQWLFDETLLRKKLEELGFDAWPASLGRPRSGSIPLNGWRLSQYREVWNRGGWDVLHYETKTDAGHLDLVERHAAAFRGRGLTLEDLTTSLVLVLLRKRSG